MKRAKSYVRKIIRQAEVRGTKQISEQPRRYAKRPRHDGDVSGAKFPFVDR